MIKYHYLTDFELVNPNIYTKWLERLSLNEDKIIGAISIIFADDEYVKELNRKYLNHDYYTDILTFDASSGNMLEGDIFISIDRVKENCGLFRETFDRELIRVMAHGLLHMMGYKDNEEPEKKVMRLREEFAIGMFHVEQKEKENGRDGI